MMATRKRALVRLAVAAALVAIPSSAFVAPSVAGGVRLQAKAKANDDEAVADFPTREARILAPLSLSGGLLALTTSALTLGGLPGLANAGNASLFESTVRKNFPGAMANSGVALRVASALQERGYSPTNSLVGSSLCSDEINDTPESLVADLQNKLRVDGTFNLGGLGGLPFVGTSGMGAFVSHCPENGKVFIVFGPHVGVSDSGVVGKVERIGRKGPSTSCGAGIGAYKAIMAEASGEDDKFFLGTKDFQEDYIIAKLRDKLAPVKNKESDNESIAFVTNKMYDLVWEMLRGQINSFTTKPGFWDGISEVSLLGGIVVNRGHGEGYPGGEDYYQPLMLKSLRKEGETDIYGDVFGDFPALAAPHRDAKYA